VGEEARRRDVVRVIGGFEVLVSPGWHHAERYPIEADHAWLRDRLRPVRGPRTGEKAEVSSSGRSSSRKFAAGMTISGSTHRRVAIAGTAELIVHHARTVGV
jgi:hypothetical protein